MIISHKHKFIYFKVNKTASTSTEILLESICDENDIVTPIKDAYSAGAPKEHQMHKPRNFKKYDFMNHASAELVKSKIGHEIFDSYFKFMSVRNPWDRVISHYFMNPLSGKIGKKKYDKNIFLRFLDTTTIKMFSNWSELDKKYILDECIRYENLEKDTLRILKKFINIDKIVYPVAKTKINPHDKHYTQYYDDETRELVAEKFAKDIEYFGYEFNPHPSVKKLLCIYTHLADAERLNQFKNTSLYNRAVSDPDIKIIEVYAGAPETKYLDGKLFLSCAEKYSELSIKTYEMLKYCTENFQFDHLIKIDCSIVGYTERGDTLFKPNVLNHFYNLNRIESMLFSDKWLDDHKGYCGSHLLGNGTRAGYEKWANSCGVTMNYHAEFLDGTPFFYTGKMYAVGMEFAKYIVARGQELAVRHVKNVGGSEDTFVGRMFGKFMRIPGWECTDPWLDDYRESSRINRESSVRSKSLVKSDNVIKTNSTNYLL